MPPAERKVAEERKELEEPVELRDRYEHSDDVGEDGPYEPMQMLVVVMQSKRVRAAVWIFMMVRPLVELAIRFF